MQNNENSPWTTLSAEVKYDNAWINVTEYQVLNPNGGRGIYGKVHYKNLAIGIIVLDDDDHTWLVGQFRFPINQYSWEIPEGGGDPDKEPLESAKRELLEETGIRASSWIEIQRMHVSNSITDELGFIFLARDLSFGDAEPEETEQLAIRKIPFEDAYQLVVKGEITDSLTVAAIYKIKILKLTGQLP